MKVRVGSNIINDMNTANGYDYSILSIRKHPKHRESDYDVAVVRVEGHMQGLHVAAIDLSETNYFMMAGQVGTVSGFGRLSAVRKNKCCLNNAYIHIVLFNIVERIENTANDQSSVG